jgi:hypothetical protein
MARYKIPTYNAGVWEYTIFPDRVAFRDFVKSLFKEPGLYNFDETAYLFNEQARTFQKKKMFCEAPEGSQDFIEYWDTEKEKCRKGVIFKNGKGDVWYLPRFYYHWINFLRIYFKVAKKFEFPEIRDVHYHIALYEILAELNDKNVVCLKKRQVAWTYFHMCRIYNKYLFEEGFVGKIAASDKKYINATNGCWKFLAEYHNFTNKETAWSCTNLPDKEFSWQQKVETKTVDGRKVQIGTMATITGVSMDKDPVSGVAGATDEFDYEEGGIAPTADTTYGFMRQAMREGALTSGIFVIGGSVGDLSQCNPLKEFLLHPVANDFYPVYTNLLDENGTEGETGLFIPEQWSMPPFIDKFGNSLVKEALEYLDNEYARIEKEKAPEAFQLEVSQRPRNIKEAFAIRTVSVFPVKHTTRQVKKIEEGSVYLKYVDLERTDENKITYKDSKRQPCPYPISRTASDKRGCVVIHQFPGENPAWGNHYASVDPIEVGRSDTSDSLASVYIYATPVEVVRIDAEGSSTTFLEGGKLVAELVCRYDDPNETNEQISMLVELYNAWTLSENNKTSFINYMIAKKRAKYLVPASEMLFDKELDVKQNVFQKYGYTRTPALWKKLLEYGINYLSEELGHETSDTGEITKIKYGVERISFIWLLREMQQYQDKGNFDRLSSYCALMAFAKIQEAKGIRKKIERKEESTNKQKIPNFDRNTFLKSVGRPGSAMNRAKVNPFKSIGRR